MVSIVKIRDSWQRNLICMWLSQLLVNTGFSAAFSFIPLYLGEAKFQLADTAARGYYTSRFYFFGMLAYAIFTPIWGALADRWGVKIMLYRGSFVTALVYPLMGITSSVHWLLALRFMTGALSGTTIAAQMLLVKTTPNERQGYALGVLGTAIWGGTLIGDVLGGLVVYRFGYTATFMLCGALFFISGLFVVYYKRNWQEGKVDRKTLFPVHLPAMPQYRKIFAIKSMRDLQTDENNLRFEDSIGLIGDWRKSGPAWEIPYRSLCPADGTGAFLAAGRCIGSLGDAWEVTRVIPTAALTGQVAGVAASMSVETGTNPCRLDPAKIQERLRGLGFPLHLPEVGLSYKA